MTFLENIGFLVMIVTLVLVFLAIALVMGLIVRFTRFAEGSRRAPHADRDQD